MCPMHTGFCCMPFGEVLRLGSRVCICRWLLLLLYGWNEEGNHLGLKLWHCRYMGCVIWASTVGRGNSRVPNVVVVMARSSKKHCDVHPAPFAELHQLLLFSDRKWISRSSRKELAGTSPCSLTHNKTVLWLSLCLRNEGREEKRNVCAASDISVMHQMMRNFW